MKSLSRKIFSYESLIIIVIVVGFGIFKVATESTLEDPSLYVAPKISELHISKGMIDIKKYSKTTYKITLDTVIGNQITNLEFLCNPPGKIFNFDCTSQYIDNKWQGFRNVIDNQQATVWWSDIPGTRYKRIYQLDVNGHTYINYEKQVKYYKENKPPTASL